MKLVSLVLIGLTTTLGFAQVPYPGNDADHGVSRPAGLLDPYTGNVAFTTNDLVVSGAVGQHGLAWRRQARSRTPGTQSYFGLGHNWTHNWQWEMTDAGVDSQGRAVITVFEPRGAMKRFTETAPGQWWSAPSCDDRVVSTGDSFVVQRPEGEEVRFVRHAAPGGHVFLLNELTDRTGNVWRFSWQDDRLVQVTEPAGRWLKINYGMMSAPGAGRNAPPFAVISRVEASDGQAVAYEYDFSAGADYPVLTAVAYPDATHAAYTYVAPRAGDRLLLAQANDPKADRTVRGRVFHYRTEPEAAVGQILQICAAEGGAVMLALAADAGKERGYAITETNGATTYRTYAPGGNTTEQVDALGFSRKQKYDADGRGFLTATTDELGKVTRFENDANGRVVKTTFSDGSMKSWQRDSRGRVLAETDEMGQTRNYTRDANGRITKVGYPDGSTTETTYNEFGQVLTSKSRSGAITTNSYDARGVRTKTTNAVGAVTTYAYDAQDRLAATTDPHGNTTRYERDVAGRVTATLYADGSRVDTGYDTFGQVILNMDALGAPRATVYDVFGRVTSRVDALGNATRTEYAASGQKDGAPFDRPVRTITPTGRVTATTYDAAGRVVSRTTAAGTKEAVTTRMAYDATGRVVSTTNARGKTAQFFYDARGRRTKVMSALNHATTTDYDAAGRKLSETDAKGNTTHWTYDAMGRELTKTDAKGQVTRREYDAAGRLVTLIDAKLNAYRFEYDLIGRQTALVYPDGSRETTDYDSAGLKVRYINRAGAVQTFAYDSSNREISSEWNDGSQKVTKTYDATGRMTLEDNGVSRITFTYDEDGRLASETQDLSPIVTNGSFDPAPRTVSYAYNADGQHVSFGYPDATSVQITYNARGLREDILADDEQRPIAHYEYDATGNAIRMPRENDTATEREFDAENKMTHVVEQAPKGQQLARHEYLYDEAGNRTATLAAINQEGRGAGTETLDTYQYDETYQMTGADYAAPVQGNRAGAPAATVRYTYDAVGNRVQVDENGAVARYMANNLNQYTQVGEFAPTHDRNGNLSSMGQWLYRYDGLNRLVFASNGTTTAKFYYDAKNRCVARSFQSVGSTLQTPSSTLTLNTYDNWNLIEERDARGAQVARYMHGQKIDEIVVMVNKHGTFYPHHDALGNVTMLTDRFGRMVERYTYSIAGEVMITDASGNALTRSSIENRWMFTGREWLSEVGLYDYRNRVYSAESGRFLQTDPVRFDAGDSNIYRYVSNNYLGFVDPYGLDEAHPYEFSTDGLIDLNISGNVNVYQQANGSLGYAVNGGQSDSWGAQFTLGGGGLGAGTTFGLGDSLSLAVQNFSQSGSDYSFEFKVSITSTSFFGSHTDVYTRVVYGTYTDNIWDDSYAYWDCYYGE